MTQNVAGTESKRKYLSNMKKIFTGAFKTLVLALIVFPFLCPNGSYAQNELNIEDRLLRMEREIQMLKEKNTNLEKEVERLRQPVVREEKGAKTETPADARVLSQAVKESKPQLGVAYNKGLIFSTEDDSFKLKMGGRLTARYTGSDSLRSNTDELSVARARIYANATIQENYALRIQTEFANDPKLKDGYLSINHVPQAKLQVGQFKPPYTFENLHSHKYLDFADRSIAVNNMRKPSRDIGVMLHGKLCNDYMAYQLALLNGSGENKGDDNDAKDVAGRLNLQPFRDGGNEALSKLQIGVSGTVGNQEKDFSAMSFSTIAGTKFVDFAANTMHTGDRIRLGTEAVLPIGPASVKAEWTQMQLDDLELAAVKDDSDFCAWYISGSYLLTGEEKTTGRLSPANPFDPSKGTWGAWEVAARYSSFKSDSDIFELGMATGAERAEAYTIGLNWYLNDFVRMILDYEHTDFDNRAVAAGESLDDEDAFLLQCQIEF